MDAGAVAAAAKDSWTLAVLGILVSIPIVVWGSKIVLKLMDRYPHLQPGVDDTPDDEPNERFADAARELFKKRMRG